MAWRLERGLSPTNKEPRHDDHRPRVRVHPPQPPVAPVPPTPPTPAKKAKNNPANNPPSNANPPPYLPASKAGVVMFPPQQQAPQTPQQGGG